MKFDYADDESYIDDENLKQRSSQRCSIWKIRFNGTLFNRHLKHYVKQKKWLNIVEFYLHTHTLSLGICYL
jgi:hypothetical protein